ncbi:ubiquitin-conjugating enzyme E2 W isoform X13 [Macaca fascicularis]|uniref:ubiquitin-conjugating enzyme E2 W isoform X13 n=1 Tax=Macaca fascicularis TaxID=9541 RepID=UPI003D1591EE
MHTDEEMRQGRDVELPCPFQKRLQKELLALQNDPPPGMTLNEKSVQNSITQDDHQIILFMCEHVTRIQRKQNGGIMMILVDATVIILLARR